eukprot:TRINITY_DN14237_c0_g1_i4.p1 TRINITY_DN14237_c0_g1~~TRINITY_DN14237_c0_g1_i4.p1  ORF type:complete len:326 (+),score=33.05 TRINITY_DN14237_c0_g1_i4:43-978(+)
MSRSGQCDKSTVRSTSSSSSMSSASSPSATVSSASSPSSSTSTTSSSPSSSALWLLLLFRCSQVIYTVATIVYRCFDGSYAEGGHFYKPPPTPAERGDSHTFTLGFSTLLLVNSLSVAFLCHYNGCKYYREFVRHSPGRFFNTVGTAFAAIDIIFMVAMVAGYSTFGSLSQGVILNNYAFSDMPANIARLGMGAANMLSFPLMFSGLREAVLALIAFSCPSYAPLCDQVWYQNILSGIMVGVISLSAVIITDASLVVGLVGSICGSAIIYVIPCLLYERASHRFNLGNDKPPGFSLVAVRAIGAVLLECFS